MKQYDLIVIGGGPGGDEAAAIAAKHGKSVALIEKNLLGGTCLNRGCVPTKCLCAAAERILDIQSAADYGVQIENYSINYAVAARRAHLIVEGLREDVEAMLKDVEIFQGKARIAEGRTVVTDTHFLKGHKIIIATGSKPAQIPIEGSEYVINSDEFLALENLPDRLIIIGGGVIGLEFASIISAYGKDVTVLEYCPEILPGFDQEIAKRLRTYLTRRGIRIVTGAKVTSVSSERVVSYEAKGKVFTLPADMVISAIGRRPVTPDGMENAGVETDSKGYIIVNDAFETTANGIYAIGDVNGRCMLAHAASAQARIVCGLTTHVGVTPSVVFTMPECASVGACVADCEDYQSAKVPFSSNAKALAAGKGDGLLKLVYRNDDHRLLGCQAVGAHAGELIAVTAMAIDAGCTIDQIAAESILAHPGFSEIIQAAASRGLER